MSDSRSQYTDFGSYHSHSNDTSYHTTLPFTNYTQASSPSSHTIDTRIRSILLRNTYPASHSSSVLSHAHTISSPHIRHNHINSNNSSRNSYLTTSSTSQVALPAIPNIPTASHTTVSSRNRHQRPVSDIWFISAPNNLHVDTATTQSPIDSLHDSVSSTGSFSMYSTERLWAENREEMALAQANIEVHSIEHSSMYDTQYTGSTDSSTVTEPSPPSFSSHIPSPAVMFPIFSAPLQSSPYFTYPDDDDWSISSLESDSTATTSATTVPSISDIQEITEIFQYHNPRYLGCLNYYFPPRMQPMPIAPTNSVESLLPEDSFISISLPPSISPAPTTPYLSTTVVIPPRPPSMIYDPTRTIVRHETLSQMQLESTIPPSVPNPTSQGIQDNSTPLIPHNTLLQTTLDQCWDGFHDSSSNIRPNEHWGDTIDVKYSNTVRIYFQNVNSFGLSQGTSKVNTIFQSMQQMDCDIATFVQTSVNWRFLHLRNRLRMSLQRIFPKHKMNISSNKFHSTQPALPGGCAQIVTGDWTGRIVEFIHDFRKMGRWCGVKIRLKGDRNLFLITAYRVCQQSSSQIGPETAYRQQELMLALEGIDHPDPRKQFILDLTKCVKEWQSSTDDVLISLDANEQLGDSAKGLTYMMRECKLIDIFHHHHGIYPDFETFDLGSKRLDYIIGSASLLPFTKRCGYLPFYQGIPSDHRGMFLDLSLELIDGLTRLENTPTRLLHSAFQKDVYKYKQFVEKEFLTNQIHQKALSLYNQSDAPLARDDTFRSQLESLDSLILTIQLRAELKCCKKRTKYDWSDEIHFTKQCLAYWMIRRKKNTRHRDPAKVCLRIYNTLPLEHQKFIDVATGSPKHNWFKTKERLQNLMAHHRKSMAEMQHDLIDNEATYTGITIDKVQAKAARITRDKKLYNTLRHHFHPAQRSGINHILVPDKDENNLPTDIADDAKTWRMESQPQQVLDRLFERNVRHFGQAEGTPFTVSPLLDHFGYDGMTPDGQTLIQEGTLPETLNHDHNHATKILHRLTEGSSTHQTLSDLITFEKFTKTIRKWSEATSTSPSGKHLGHYKSLTSIDSYSSKYTEAAPDPGPAILRVLYQVAAAAFQAGMTLPRWQKVTTCMIEKIPGQPRLNKLRVIHLYEADYNAFNKMIWQRGIVWDAHTKGILNTAQSGSRPNRTSIEVVISKGQKYTYSSLTRTAMATMDNDAKSCYDRIVATLALLTSHKFGVPANFCTTVGETLRNMQFSIRTAMGDSTQTYCHSPLTPIYGVGQGGTASPAFWLLVSSILFDCYQRQASGMVMSDPTKTITIQQWLEALVDDTSLFTNLIEGDDIHTLVRTLEKDAQEWEQFLSASGGCLELSKCFYYILAWTFDVKGDASPMSIEEVHRITRPIHLQEHDKPGLTIISSKPPQEAHKTLGVWKSMDDNVAEQIKVLTKRSANLANIVATSGLWPYQADVALRMIYTPALAYCLPSISIPQAILDKIQYKAIESFLPALGYNPKFPSAMVFGPKEYGGIGAPHLYTEMNVSKLEYIMMHIRNNSDIGIQFRINLNWIQLNLGISTPLFEYDKEITYLDNWFISLHSFMRQINSKLIIKDTLLPIFNREGDCCIMEAFLRCNITLSGKQIRYLNNWRRYFRVQTLSDITHSSGDKLIPMYLKFDSADHLSTRTSKLDWPLQAKPLCQTTFKLWTKCIRTCFLQGRSNKLVHPLGKWIVNPTESQSEWQTYIHVSYTKIIQRSDLSLKLFDQVLRSTSCVTTFAIDEFKNIDTIPNDYFPVEVDITATQIIASHSKQRMSLQLSIPSIEAAADIEQAIQLSADWKRHTLQHFHLYDNPAFVSILSQKDTDFLVVSDGGLREGRGSFGVAFGTNADDMGMIEGPAPGNSVLLTSLRSEAYGLLAGLAFLNLYVISHNVVIPSNRKILLYSDNLGLVLWVADLIQNVSYPRMYLRPEADVLLQIQHEISIAKQLNFILQIEHVHGHQDDHVPYNELSRPAQLNVQADQFATNYLNNGKYISYDEFSNNPVSLYIGDDIITRIYNKLLRSASCSPALRLYFIKKFQWHPNTPDLIWWQVHGKSLEALSPMDQRRVRKYIISWLPTCKRLHLMGDSPTPNCPSCKVVIESQQHLVQCTSQPRRLVVDRWLKDLNEFLSIERYTPVMIKEIINNHLVAIIYPHSIPPAVPEYDPEIQRALAAQEKIGWQHFFYGRVSIIWGSIIGRHLSFHRVGDKEMTIDRWGQTVITKMFQLILNIWQQRNIDGHQLTEKNESQLSRQRILDKIVSLQQSNPDVRYCHRQFVVCPMETLNQYSLGNLLAWHRAAQSIIRSKKSKNVRQQSIRAIFSPLANHSTGTYAEPLPLPEPDPDPTRLSPPPAPNLAICSPLENS